MIFAGTLFLYHINIYTNEPFCHHMKTDSFESVIRQYIQLDSPNANGWCSVLCKSCGDKGHKGKRAAFIFDPNGTIGYHCFNCGAKTKFDPNDTKLSKSMEQILQDFDVPESSIDIVRFNLLKNRSDFDEITTDFLPKIDIEPDEIPLPKHFYLLKDASPNDQWAVTASTYLEHRKIDLNTYSFMLSKPVNTTDKKVDKWLGRLIIPVYKDDKLIFYQGRALDGIKTNKKYESPSVAKDRVLFGFDKLFISTDYPLFIMEGFFDAHLVDGIAILGNQLSKSQIEWINKSKRKKVYIPDRYGDGQIGALEAIKQGWSISTPLIDDTDVKDVNEAIVKYGKMYVTKSIMDNISEGDAAKMRLGIWSNDQKSSKKETKRPPYKKRHSR